MYISKKCHCFLRWKRNKTLQDVSWEKTVNVRFVIIASQHSDEEMKRFVALTDHRLKDVLHASDELLVNLDDQITQNLPIVSEVKVQQALFVLLGSVVFCVDLRKQTPIVIGETYTKQHTQLFSTTHTTRFLMANTAYNH